MAADRRNSRNQSAALAALLLLASLSACVHQRIAVSQSPYSATGASPPSPAPSPVRHAPTAATTP